jgi:hypothetical protein
MKYGYWQIGQYDIVCVSSSGATGGSEPFFLFLYHSETPLELGVGYPNQLLTCRTEYNSPIWGDGWSICTGGTVTLSAV